MRLRVLLLLFAFRGSSEVKGKRTMETGLNEDNLKLQDCPFGVYGNHSADTCICLSSGLWRISKEYCSTPQNLIGVKNGSEYCFYNSEPLNFLEKVLSFEVPEVAQFSSTMHKYINHFDELSTTVPITEPVYQGKSTLITFGERKWTLRTPNNETFCLIHQGDPLREFCLFPDLEFANESLRVQAIEPNCDTILRGTQKIESFKCLVPWTSRTCHDALWELDPAKADAIMVRDHKIPTSKPKITTARTTTTTTTSTTTTPAPDLDEEEKEESESKSEESKSEEDVFETYQKIMQSLPLDATSPSPTTLNETSLSLESESNSDEFQEDEAADSMETSLKDDLDDEGESKLDKNVIKRDSDNPEESMDPKASDDLKVSNDSKISDDPIVSDDAPSDVSKDVPKNTSRKLEGDLNEEEDDVGSDLKEIGHKLVIDQIDLYIDNVVGQLVGVVKDKNVEKPGALQGRYPVLKLLNIMKMIMKKTCSPVKEDFFEMALNTFIRVQLESFHVKEPFISPMAYRRIEFALKSCYNEARPHVFHGSSDNSTGCEKKNLLPDVTTSELDVHGDGKKIVKLDPTPPSARSTMEGNAIREPLIETVWKMVVNAHSYCYPHFKAYFNDHQTLTVSLLPLFNNQIQDIWLKEEGYDTTKGRLYGGLLGDTHKLLEDVDNCVAASRYLSQYPWYMSRPIKDSSNKWRRRKRDLASDEYQEGDGNNSPVYIDNGKKLCLFDPDDPVTFLDKPVCS